MRFGRCTIFLTVGAPAPLQEAGAVALSLPQRYYEKLAEGYRVRRDHLMPALTSRWIQVLPAARRLLRDDRYLRLWLRRLTSHSRNIWCRKSEWRLVPGSSFYRDPRDGARRCASPSARNRRRWMPQQAAEEVRRKFRAQARVELEAFNAESLSPPRKTRILCSAISASSALNATS